MYIFDRIRATFGPRTDFGDRPPPAYCLPAVSGKKGVVDMTGISGYYTFLAMQLNMARYEFSGAGPRLSRFPN
jgi:hypothetical protein